MKRIEELLQNEQELTNQRIKELEDIKFEQEEELEEQRKELERNHQKEVDRVRDEANKEYIYKMNRYKEFDKFKDDVNMILKDWDIELVETTSDTKLKYSLVMPGTEEIGFSFDFNNPEKPFFFTQDGEDKTETKRGEYSAIQTAHILKEATLDISRYLKWEKNSGKEYVPHWDRDKENALKECANITYEFDIPRLGETQNEMLQYTKDYLQEKRGKIKQTAEILSQTEEINDAFVKDKKQLSKEIEENKKKIEELKVQQEENSKTKKLEIKKIEEDIKKQEEALNYEKEQHKTFKDKINEGWVHSVNFVQANVAKAKLTIQQTAENAKEWFDEHGKNKVAILGVTVAVMLITKASINIPPTSIDVDNIKSEYNEHLQNAQGAKYSYECDDGRTVYNIADEEQAKQACALRNTTRLERPDGYSQKELSDEKDPDKVSEVSIKMDELAKQDREVHTLEETEKTTINEATMDKTLERYEEEKRNETDVIKIDNINKDNIHQVAEKKNEIENSKEDNKVEDKTVDVIYSAEDTTIKDASDKLEDYQHEAEEQEKIMENLESQERREYEYRY